MNILNTIGSGITQAIDTVVEKTDILPIQIA